MWDKVNGPDSVRLSIYEGDSRFGFINSVEIAVLFILIKNNCFYYKYHIISLLSLQLTFVLSAAWWRYDINQGLLHLFQWRRIYRRMEGRQDISYTSCIGSKLFTSSPVSLLLITILIFQM